MDAETAQPHHWRHHQPSGDLGNQQDCHHHQHPKHHSPHRPGRDLEDKQPHVGVCRNGRALQQSQQRVRRHGEPVCRSTRHRPGCHRARRSRTEGRRRLREAGERQTALLVGIYGEHCPRLRVVEERTADRPGAGCGLRVHLRRCDLSGGRVRIRHHRHPTGTLRQVAQEHQQQPAAGQLGPDDEERVLPRIAGGEGEVPTRREVSERLYGRLPQLHSRGEGERPAHHQGAGSRPTRQQQQSPQQRLLRLRGWLHRIGRTRLHPQGRAFRKLSLHLSQGQGHRRRGGEKVRLHRTLRQHQDRGEADSREEQISTRGTVSRNLRQRHLLRRIQRATGFGARHGRRCDPHRRLRLCGGLQCRRGDYPQPEYHRRWNTRQRVAREQHRLRTDAQNHVWRELGVRLLEELPDQRNPAAPHRTGPHHQGDHGRRASQKHPRGLQPQLEAREPVAHQHARQNTVPAPHAAILHLVHRRVCQTLCRSGQRNAGQRILSRRLREHQEHHRRHVAHIVGALQRALVKLPSGLQRQDGADQRIPTQPSGLVHHRPALHTTGQLAHTRTHQERPGTVVQPLCA